MTAIHPIAQPHPRRVPVAGALLGGFALLSVLTGCGGSPQAGSSPTGPAPHGSGAATASPSPSSTDTYGGFPSYLPSDTVDGSFEHQIRDASAHRPVLATQGDTVRVHVGAGSVLATVAGPAVPVAGQQYQAPTSPATWTVVLKGVRGAVRLDPATFQGIDEEGSVYDFKEQGPVPRTVRAGQTVRFKLFSAGFKTGEGRLRWIPVGHLAPVEWDFTVETD